MVDNSLGPTTAFLMEEVERRKIPYKRFAGSSLITLGYGCRQKKLRTAVTDLTSALGLEIAGDKEETKELLAEAHIPTPQGLLVYSEREMLEAIDAGKVRFPLVVKPLNGNHGRGITTNIRTEDKARFGYWLARDVSRAVIVEEFIEGDDYRFLVINYKLVAVAKRTPAMIIGDGKSTILQLIDNENKNPQRGDTTEHVLAPIRIDEITEKILDDNKLTLDSVLEAGRKLYVKDTANISAGGTADDVTDIVHPENIFMAERIARLFNLDICGIDILATDITIPVTREVGAVVEVNAGPGLRMHSDPSSGKKRNVAQPIIDMLFPDGVSRVPVIAAVGDDAGKLVRLIAHLAEKGGHKTGFSTGKEVSVCGHVVCRGEHCPDNIRTVLFDPTIDFAAVECTGDPTSGMGFDQCDVAIVTSIPKDHPEMAEKLVSSITDNGYVLLNADDDEVYALREKVKGNVVLYSKDGESERIAEQQENAGWAATLRDDHLDIFNGKFQARIEEVKPFRKWSAELLLPALAVATIQNFELPSFPAAMEEFGKRPDDSE